MIHVYNLKKEEHAGRGNFYIGRGSVLGNPFSHLPEDKCKAKFKVKDRATAIEKYNGYFDRMYVINEEFKKAVDILYERYKSGEEIYLACYCAPEPCHGDIIAKKLQQRLLKERLRKDN